MFDFIQRLKRRRVQPTFLASLDDLDEFKYLVNHQKCPTCKQNGLQLVNYTTGPDGWDADIICDNCNFHGVVNSTGFTFKKINSKGKARD